MIIAILLYFLLEIITFNICAKQNNYSALISYLNIYDHGFKYNGSMDDFEMEYLSVVSTKRIYIDLLFTLVPFINIIYNSLKNNYLKNRIFYNLSSEDRLEMLSEEEKSKYFSLENDFQKIVYAEFLNKKYIDAEFVGFNGMFPVFENNKLCVLRYDRLTPLGYTIDDVKKISDFLESNFIIGKVEGVNVAIISKMNLNINSILRENDSLDNAKTFEQMDPEVITGERFIIYPFDDISDKEEELNNLIRKLYDERPSNISYSRSNELPLVRERVLDKKI